MIEEICSVAEKLSAWEDVSHRLLSRHQVFIDTNDNYKPITHKYPQ